MKEVFTFITLLLGTNSSVQISVKTEYIGNSGLYDAIADTNTGNGSTMIYSAGMTVPLSMQVFAKDGPYKRATIWGVTLSGTFVRMDNHSSPIGKELSSQMMNLGATVLRLCPLKECWSILAALGTGSHTPENRLSTIRIDENVLANGILVFIWHWRPNLEIGGGVVLSNSFGYPMAFPALYLRYRGGLSGKFVIDVNLLDDVKVAFGYDYSENLSLKLIANIEGYSVYLRRNGRKETFSLQTFSVGLGPELKLSKHISIPVIFGGSFIHSERYRERALSAMFAFEAKDEDGSAHPSVFSLALYFTTGITIR